MGRQRPDWDALYGAAAEQEGHFSTAQAAGAGYSPPLLDKYLRNGRIRRVRRGVYRLVHFPPGEHEDLVVLWLWTSRHAVMSHETALALHRLSDVMPTRVHLTLPATWSKRRLRVPERVVLHFGRVAPEERAWVGSVPVTSVTRTLADCAEAHLSPELLRQATREAVERGLATRAELRKHGKDAR